MILQCKLHALDLVNILEIFWWWKALGGNLKSIVSIRHDQVINILHWTEGCDSRVPGSNICRFFDTLVIYVSPLALLRLLVQILVLFEALITGGRERCVRVLRILTRFFIISLEINPKVFLFLDPLTEKDPILSFEWRPGVGELFF